MITKVQLDSLTEEELGYLYLCFKTEWQNIGMKYPFNFNFIKSFKNQAVLPILNKYSNILKDEHRNTITNIVEKLENNR